MAKTQIFACCLVILALMSKISCEETKKKTTIRPKIPTSPEELEQQMDLARQQVNNVGKAVGKRVNDAKDQIPIPVPIPDVEIPKLPKLPKLPDISIPNFG